MIGLLIENDTLTQTNKQAIEEINKWRNERNEWENELANEWINTWMNDGMSGSCQNTMKQRKVFSFSGLFYLPFKILDWYLDWLPTKYKCGHLSKIKGSSS